MAWELWPFPRSMSRSRLVLLVLSLGAGSFVSTCLLLLFILRARRRRRQRIGNSTYLENGGNLLNDNGPNVFDATTELNDSSESTVADSGPDQNHHTLFQRVQTFQGSSISVSGFLVLHAKHYNSLWQWLAENTRLYVITQCQSDEEEESLKSQLVGTLGDIPPFDCRRLLFCSTESGRAHIARHFQVAVHLDESNTVLKQLGPFVPELIHINSVTC